jgi:hypothetical protein
MAVLLDFNPLIIGAVHVAQNNVRSADELNVSFIRHLFLNQILSFRKQFSKYGDFVICCDSKNSWRKDLFPYYKASRKKSREESKINWQVVFESIDSIKQEMDEFFPYKVVYADRAEADDVIAVLVKYFQENELEGIIEQSPQKIMIVSGDKDFKQLQIFDNVEQYSPLLGKRIVENRPDLYLKEHIIRGDTGDGVPNIFSDDDTFVSEKRQKPIRQEKLDKWLESEGTSFIEDDVVLRNFHRNKKMVDLLNEIPAEIETSIVNRYNSASGKTSNLFNYFIQNKLKNLVTEIQNF